MHQAEAERTRELMERMPETDRVTRAIMEAMNNNPEIQAMTEEARMNAIAKGATVEEWNRWKQAAFFIAFYEYLQADEEFAEVFKDELLTVVYEDLNAENKAGATD